MQTKKIILHDLPISELNPQRDWQVMETKNLQQLQKYLEEEDVTVIVANEQTIYEQDWQKLKIWKNPTRIIARQTAEESQRIYEQIAQGKIHRVVASNVEKKELISIIDDLVEEYNYVTTLPADDEIDNSSRKLHTGLLDLTLDLIDISEISDFTNQYANILEGLQSMVRLNMYLHFERDTEVHLQRAFDILSDLELFANQYDQKTLIIYVNIIRSLVMLEQQQLEKAMKYYNYSVRTFYWISNEHVKQELVEIVRNFPIYEDEWFYIQTGQKEYEPTVEDKLYVRYNIKRLLQMDIKLLINISETLIQHLGIDYQPIQYLIVVRDSLPVYIMDLSDEEFEISLITGFVDALSNFLSEVVKGKGDIDTISHDSGVLLIHKKDGLRYVIVAKYDDIHLHIGLRQFSEEVSDIMTSIPENEFIDEEEEKEVDQIFKRIFSPSQKEGEETVESTEKS